MVKRSIDQKLRLRNFDAKHWRTETGAVVKSRKGLNGVEGRKRYLSPVERKRPQRGKQSRGNPMQKVIEKNKGDLPISSERMGTLGCVNKRTGGKRVCS